MRIEYGHTRSFKVVREIVSCLSGLVTYSGLENRIGFDILVFFLVESLKFADRLGKMPILSPLW